MISIITPWLNASELIPDYEASVKGAEVIIIDNCSDWFHAEKITQMVERLHGLYIRNRMNTGFAFANNQGLAQAHGDIVLFLNNDIRAESGWLAQVGKDVKANTLTGPILLNKYGIDYVEGFCIAGRRETWDKIGGWPADLPGMYWEDNILALTALEKGVKLERSAWKIQHISNYTSKQTPGAYDHSLANEAEFLRRLNAYHNRIQ